MIEIETHTIKAFEAMEDFVSLYGNLQTINLLLGKQSYFRQ